MALSVQGSSNFFITQRNQQADILHQNTVFQAPTDQLRETSLFRENQVFREPDDEDTNRRSARRQSDQPSPLGNQQNERSLGSIFAPIPAEVHLGESLDRITRFENAPPRGGNTLEVSGNNVTVSNESGESIAFNAADDGRLIHTRDDQFVLRNDSTETSLTIEPGSEVTTDGAGQLTVFGEDNPVTVQAGNNLETSDSTAGLSIRNPNRTAALQLSESNNTMTVESQREGETDTLTLRSDAGSFIEFTQGESGSLSRNDDGSLTVTNEITGETTTFASDAELTVGGRAQGTLENTRSAGTLDLEGDQSLSLNENDDGEITLRNETSAPATSIAREPEPPQPTRPLQLRTFGDLENRQLRSLTDNLLIQPLQEESERGREAEEQRQDEQVNRRREENEENNRQNEERNRSILANSPFERSNPDKFSQLRENTNRNAQFGERQNQNQFGFNQSSLQAQFGASGNANRSSVSFQA